VLIGDEDELGSFIFRTTSYNSIRTLAARLHYFAAVSGNLLACLPLELKLRGKSTTQSYRSAIYYVDLGVRRAARSKQRSPRRANWMRVAGRLGSIRLRSTPPRGLGS
jgi:hypothetical protein